MDIVLLVARLLLAGVFIVAGFSKLADIAGSRQAMRNFGVPSSLAAPLGAILPIAELATAVLLIPTATARWGALGALGLLLAFIGGIATNLARGKQPECHCFGQLHSSPAGWPTLTRNGALATAASVIVWQGSSTPGPSVFAWTHNLTMANRVATGTALLVILLAAVVGWAAFQLVSQNGRLLLRLEELEAIATGEPALDREVAAARAQGLPVGTPAPDFNLPGLDGKTVNLQGLRAAGKPVVLIFTDPMCGPCNALLPEVGRWQMHYASAVTIAVMTRGALKDNLVKSTEYGLTHVLIQQDGAVAQAFQVQGTPTAVLVQPDGTIDSLPALGPNAIRSLVTRMAETGAPTPATSHLPAASPGGPVHVPTTQTLVPSH